MNIKYLSRLLQNANIQFSGCTENGIVWDLDRSEIQNRPDVLAVLAAYDETPFEEEIAEQEQATINLKNEYQNALNTLEQIRDTQNMTQAQAVQAVQYLAKIMLFIVKLLYRNL